LCSSGANLIASPAPGEADPAKVPLLRQHYQPEFTFDTNTDAASWSKQTPGLHAAFGSTDERYLRCEVPLISGQSTLCDLTGWRGERVNSQVLVWSSTPQDQIRVLPTDLRDNKGRVIARQHVRLNLVRYVVSNLPYKAKAFSCDLTNSAAYVIPDRLELFERFDLPPRTIRPIWLSIDIPPNSAPGDYTASVDVRSSREHARLQLKLHVQEPLLPPPRDWKFRLDLWQNPWVLASHFQVEPWSEQHKALLKRHLQLYADAGGKYITTYTVHSPWSDNSYVLERTMIQWLKTTAGSWKFDYSIFDQYVELAMAAGINGAISIYTPIPWENRFRYLEEASGNFVDEKWPPDSPQFKAFWNVFLNDLKAHLKTRGWLEKTYIGINENPLESTIAAVKLIKAHSPEWKITYAGDWHPELASLLDDYSVIITSEPSTDELEKRAQRRSTTTYYVCCAPPQPNNFVFSAPVESRFIGWYAAAYGYNGFLRWAYDAWPADPMRDARHTLWPAGDCFLVYPGGTSSIRFEKLREGIIDFEKIRLLREWTSRSSSSTRARDLMRSLDQHLNRLSAERDHAKRNYDTSNLVEEMDQGKSLINALSAQVRSHP
jgi:hypothetical protein